MTYAYDPELAPAVPALPVPEPASPTSGVAEAIAVRELVASFYASAAEVGAVVGDATGLVPDTQGVNFEDVKVPGFSDAPDVLVRVYRPDVLAPHPLPAMLNIHGGGFFAGSILHATGAGRMARELGVVVVDVEYRLAPEHPAPAAVEDCFAALRWLHAQSDDLGVDAEHVAVVGESAGGGIAAGLTLFARDHGGPPIAFQFLGIPELDDRLDTPSMRQFDDTPMWNRYSAEQSWRWYLGGASGEDISPYASPARSTNLDGLPPAYISVMEFDPLRDEGIAYAMSLLQAGVSVELHLFPGTFHGSALMREAAISKREANERATVLRRALGLDGIG